MDGEDRLLTIRVTKIFTKPDLERAQAGALAAIQKHGKVRVLVITSNFLGWDTAGDWGDVSFAAAHDQHIEKIAIVGEQQWEDLALAFMGKGFRRVAIEYFLAADLAKARAWVTATP